MAFHPHARSPSLSPFAANLATGSADRSAILWPLPPDGPSPNANGMDTSGNGEGALGASGRPGPPASTPAVCQPLRKLTGHLDRLAR